MFTTKLSTLCEYAQLIVFDDDEIELDHTELPKVVFWDDYGHRREFADREVEVDDGSVVITDDDGEEHQIDFYMVRPIEEGDLE